ncbi:hypothetical protein [Natronomonas sp.]|uniref:hypothetical protein n=1 Tax=Natronomonas sp. TaxID=2184060 RepID=UPI0026031D68|nr:hypothetical protein [Natronomonas sp.]
MDDSSVAAEPSTESDARAEPESGFVDVRSALVGLGFIWLAAMAAIGAVQAGVYGVVESPAYLLVSVAAVALAVVAARASLRTFGYR